MSERLQGSGRPDHAAGFTIICDSPAHAAKSVVVARLSRDGRGTWGTADARVMVKMDSGRLRFRFECSRCKKPVVMRGEKLNPVIDELYPVALAEWRSKVATALGAVGEGRSRGDRRAAMLAASGGRILRRHTLVEIPLAAVAARLASS